MRPALDPIDARLITRIQERVPLVEHPFCALADELGLREQEILSRLRAMKSAGLIRQISAIFDSRALGYQSCLVAARIDDNRIDEAAAVISSHPGVSHNYRRNHAYNLWYTLGVPPDSHLGLEQTIRILHERSGANVTRLMPALRMFKLGVKFDLTESANCSTNVASAASAQSVAPVRLREQDKRMIRALQQDLPIVARPFDALAALADVSLSALLRAAERYLATGVMRRFSAVLHHRRAGFDANAMGAWIVAQEQQESFGKLAAGLQAVSHCYLRPTYPDWPYSIFTMVHARSRDQCEAVLAKIADLTGIDQYAALYSTHEYTKVRLRYFTPEIELWERQASARDPRPLRRQSIFGNIPYRHLRGFTESASR